MNNLNMRKEIPLVISTLALIISIGSFLNTLSGKSFLECFGRQSLLGIPVTDANDETHRFLPKKSIHVRVPEMNLPFLLRNSDNSVKALLTDEDNVNLIENQSTFVTCSNLSSLLLKDTSEEVSEHNSQINVLLLTNGMLSNLQDLATILDKEKNKYALRLIDLSDNTIRYKVKSLNNNNLSTVFNNVSALKNILLHVEKHKGVLVLIRNPIVAETDVLEAIAEIYPNAFLRLIWMPESLIFSSNSYLMKIFPRFRTSYIDMIVASHKKFYEWTYSLDELQREELHHLY